MCGISGRSVLKMIIAMVIVFSVIGVVIYFCPLLHALFDYKRDIAELKNQNMDLFGHFPDELPAGASGAEWRSIPKCLKGFGYYYVLTFNAGDDYLQEIYDTYAEEIGVYRYGTDIYGFEGWINEDIGRAGTMDIPLFRYKEYGWTDDIEIVVIRDERDTSCGLYMSRDKGNIGFWQQWTR